MELLYTKIISALLTPFLLIGGLFSNEPQTVGAALPSATAVFETSLASPITSSATTMTLAENTIRGGGSLSGYTCFTLDEGATQAETVCGTVSGTSVTSLQRGISQATGTTTVAALQFAHRRGTNVKITDFPIIQILKAQNNGEDTFPNPIRYDSSISTSTIGLNDSNLASVGYANSLSFGAVAAASETAAGFVELATNLQAASSTSVGETGARLVIPASLATSTYNSATSPLRVVVTKNDGKIDENFISTSTLFSNAQLATSTQIGSFPAWQIGKNVQVITTTGTSTFSVPQGITKLFVEVQGGGGGGDTTGSSDGGNGGHGGGYANEIVDVTGTSTIQVYVASSVAAATNGQWSTFGTNGFYLYATGGGTFSNNIGMGFGGDFNMSGGEGNSAYDDGSASDKGGAGGDSFYGRGGGVPASGAGRAGSGYGGGGSGTVNNTGGNGAQGIVIIRW